MGRKNIFSRLFGWGDDLSDDMSSVELNNDAVDKVGNEFIKVGNEFIIGTNAIGSCNIGMGTELIKSDKAETCLVENAIGTVIAVESSGVLSRMGSDKNISGSDKNVSCNNISCGVDNDVLCSVDNVGMELSVGVKSIDDGGGETGLGNVGMDSINGIDGCGLNDVDNIDGCGLNDVDNVGVESGGGGVFSHDGDVPVGIGADDRSNPDADCGGADFSGYGGGDDVGTDLIVSCIHGDVPVYNNNSRSIYPVIDYYTDYSGIYSCKSAVSAKWYRNVRTRCVAIPQCKMMNSTVREWDAIRKVYVEHNGSWKGRGLHSKEQIDRVGMDADAVIKRDMERDGDNQHIPFDVWAVVGAVYGHALAIYRRTGRDKGKLPSWLYMPYSELFQILNPEYRWVEISNASKIKWKRYFRGVFQDLNETRLTFDLPDERWGRVRTQYSWPVLMRTHEVFWSIGDKRQVANSLRNWGDQREPVGVKINLRGTGLFNFVFEKRSPRLVQLNNFDLKTKTLWGGLGGLCRCFHTIYMNWLVQYRNYFKKRGYKYKTLEMRWSQREMLRSFAGTRLKLRRLSTDEMQTMLDSISISARNKAGKTDKYPAHINESFVISPCVVGWNLPSDLRDEDVFAKDEDGVAHKIDLESASAEVREAHAAMVDLNRVNSNSEVLFNNASLSTHMAAIFRVDGAGDVIQDKYGRCYSFQNGVQSLRSADRLKITIDGDKVCEVDYSGLHTRMLYAMENQSCGGDIYDLGTRWYLKWGMTADEARGAVKKAMLIMINAPTQWTGYYAFKKDWNVSRDIPRRRKIPWLYDLMEDIRQKHAVISKYFCSNKGVELQWVDGKMIRNVCRHFARKGVCALPVHDSLVIARQHKDEAIAVMRAEFARMFNGASIPVKVK